MVRFGSPKYFQDRSTHDRLLTMNVYTSEDLRPELRLVLSNIQYASERSDHNVAAIRGVESGQVLRKCVHSSGRGRSGRCYQSSLPKFVRELPGLEDSSAENILSLLLTIKLRFP